MEIALKIVAALYVAMAITILVTALPKSHRFYRAHRSNWKHIFRWVYVYHISQALIWPWLMLEELHLQYVYFPRYRRERTRIKAEALLQNQPVHLQ